MKKNSLFLFMVFAILVIYACPVMAAQSLNVSTVHLDAGLKMSVYDANKYELLYKRYAGVASTTVYNNGRIVTEARIPQFYFKNDDNKLITVGIKSRLITKDFTKPTAVPKETVSEDGTTVYDESEMIPVSNMSESIKIDFRFPDTYYDKKSSLVPEIIKNTSVAGVSEDTNNLTLVTCATGLTATRLLGLPQPFYGMNYYFELKASKLDKHLLSYAVYCGNTLNDVMLLSRQTFIYDVGLPFEYSLFAEQFVDELRDMPEQTVNVVVYPNSENQYTFTQKRHQGTGLDFIGDNLQYVYVNSDMRARYTPQWWDEHKNDAEITLYVGHYEKVAAKNPETQFWLINRGHEVSEPAPETVDEEEDDDEEDDEDDEDDDW